MQVPYELYKDLAYITEMLQRPCRDLTETLQRPCRDLKYNADKPTRNLEKPQKLTSTMNTFRNPYSHLKNVSYSQPETVTY